MRRCPLGWDDELAEGFIGPGREGISEVRLLHADSRVDASFDEPNLVSAAGLLPVMRLAAAAGLWRLVADRLRVPGSVGSNPAGKIATVVAGMAAGADCIDDLDVVRSGGMRRLFGGVYAPSTLGSFLRALTWGHVRGVGVRGPGLPRRPGGG